MSRIRYILSPGFLYGAKGGPGKRLGDRVKAICLSYLAHCWDKIPGEIK